MQQLFRRCSRRGDLKILQLPKEEKEEFFSYLKNRTNELLDDAEETVEKVEHYMDEIKMKEENEWVDKLYIFKRMFRELYGLISGTSLIK